jgi:hypothetical protein
MHIFCYFLILFYLKGLILCNVSPVLFASDLTASPVLFMKDCPASPVWFAADLAPCLALVVAASTGVSI